MLWGSSCEGRPAGPRRGRCGTGGGTRASAGRLLDQPGLEYRPDRWRSSRLAAAGGSGRGNRRPDRGAGRPPTPVRQGFRLRLSRRSAYCLGVKNALGPELMDDRELRRFIRQYFSGYRGDPVEAPIELARELVFGWSSTRGAWVSTRTPTSPPPRGISARGQARVPSGSAGGKPFYVFGPYDDPGSVIRTLERTIGPGNFEVLAIARLSHPYRTGAARRAGRELLLGLDRVRHAQP